MPASVLALAAVSGCRHKSILSDQAVLQQAATQASDSETLVLQAGNWSKSEPARPGTPHGDLEIAQTLFRAEDYNKAARAFEEVADKHKKNVQVHEQALYMKAESEYQQGKYVEARDSFEELIKTYPGSPHRSTATQRLFAIADVWLEEARADVRRGHPGSFPRRFFHFDPDRKPLFDIDGHAIKNLEVVREHEPNGPLADDSLMMAAGYHFSMGEYHEADLLSDQVIHNYPRSEHQAQAHLLSAESKLHSYKGTKYDARKLEEARRTLRAALSQYPTELESERQRIYRELDEIRQEQAKSQFEIAEWYRTHGRPQSARVYYEWILKQKEFAGTKWAERAREQLAKLDSSPAVAESSAKETEKTTARESEKAPAKKTLVGLLFGKDADAERKR